MYVTFDGRNVVSHTLKHRRSDKKSAEPRAENLLKFILLHPSVFKHVLNDRGIDLVAFERISPIEI